MRPLNLRPLIDLRALWQSSTESVKFKILIKQELCWQREAENKRGTEEEDLQKEVSALKQL